MQVKSAAVSPFSPELTTKALLSAGLEPAADHDVREARRLGRSLIGPGLASVETFLAVQAKMQAAVFVHREDGAMTGVLAILLLTPEGRAALTEGRLSTLEPDLDLLTAPGEQTAAFYGWGYAGATRRAQAAVVKGATILRRRLFPDVPFFARAGTDDGSRVLTRRFGCRPYGGPEADLFWAPPLAPTQEVAA